TVEFCRPNPIPGKPPDFFVDFSVYCCLQNVKLPLNSKPGAQVMRPYHIPTGVPDTSERYQLKVGRVALVEVPDKSCLLPSITGGQIRKNRSITRTPRAITSHSYSTKELEALILEMLKEADLGPQARFDLCQLTAAGDFQAEFDKDRIELVVRDPLLS